MAATTVESAPASAPVAPPSVPVHKLLHKNIKQITVNLNKACELLKKQTDLLKQFEEENHLPSSSSTTTTPKKNIKSVENINIPSPLKTPESQQPPQRPTNIKEVRQQKRKAAAAAATTTTTAKKVKKVEQEEQQPAVPPTQVQALNSFLFNKNDKTIENSSDFSSSEESLSGKPEH